MNFIHRFKVRGIRMGIELEKRIENVKISLAKVAEESPIDLGNVCAQVIIAVDFSGSMSGRYSKGEVQGVVERALALSLAGLDDDGDIQVFFFDSQSYPMETVNAENYQGFVDRWARQHRMGGTNYSKTIDSIVKFVTTEEKVEHRRFGHDQVSVSVKSQETLAGEPPVFVIFVTDGQPSHDSEDVIKRKLTDAARLPIFWQFVGLGYSPDFLEELDTMAGRVADNVGLTDMQDALAMDDVAWFNDVIGEFFLSWLPRVRSLGITLK